MWNNFNLRLTYITVFSRYTVRNPFRICKICSLCNIMSAVKPELERTWQGDHDVPRPLDDCRVRNVVHIEEFRGREDCCCAAWTRCIDLDQPRNRSLIKHIINKKVFRELLPYENTSWLKRVIVLWKYSNTGLYILSYNIFKIIVNKKLSIHKLPCVTVFLFIVVF